MQSGRPSVWITPELFINFMERDEKAVDRPIILNQKLIKAFKLANIDKICFPLLSKESDKMIFASLLNRYGEEFSFSQVINDDKESGISYLAFQRKGSEPIPQVLEISTNDSVEDYLTCIYSGLLAMDSQKDQVMRELNTLLLNKAKSADDALIEKAIFSAIFRQYENEMEGHQAVLDIFYDFEMNICKSLTDNQRVIPFSMERQHPTPGSREEKIYENANRAMETLPANIANAFEQAKATFNVNEMTDLIDTLSAVNTIFDKFDPNGDLNARQTISPDEVKELEKVSKRLQGYSTPWMKTVSAGIILVMAAALLFCPPIAFSYWLSDKPGRIFKDAYASFFHQGMAKSVIDVAKGTEQLRVAVNGAKKQ